MKNTWLAKKKS